MNQPSENGIGEAQCSKMRQENAVRNVVNDILNGAVYSVVFQKLIEDGYGLDFKYSKSMAQKIITAARKRMREDYKEVVPNMKELLTNLCLDILSECRDSGDRQTALKAVQEVAKLTGSYDPIKTENKVEVVNIDFKLEDE